MPCRKVNYFIRQLPKISPGDFLKPADILIFDDSKSALDLKTEADLYEALEHTSPLTTKIIVAQRIASVRRADWIVVLENGQIVEQGNHEALLKKKGDGHHPEGLCPSPFLTYLLFSRSLIYFSACSLDFIASASL